MTSRAPVNFRLFYWESGEEGCAYYSRTLVGLFWAILDPVKYVLAPAIGTLACDQFWIYLKCDFATRYQNVMDCHECFV